MLVGLAVFLVASLICMASPSIVFFQASWGYGALLAPMLLMGMGATLCVGTAGIAAVCAMPFG